MKFESNWQWTLLIDSWSTIVASAVDLEAHTQASAKAVQNGPGTVPFSRFLKMFKLMLRYNKVKLFSLPTSVSCI